MAKKRFGQLSFEDKLGLIPAERMQEDDKSLNKIAREEFRKQKKAGTLEQALQPKETAVNPAEFQQYGKQIPADKVNLSTTLSTPVPNLDQNGNMKWENATFEAGANRPNNVYRNLADLEVKQRTEQMINKQNNALANSVNNPFILKGTTPENEIKKNIDAQDMINRNNALNSGDTATYDALKQQTDLDRQKVSGLNSQFGSGSSGINKILDIIKDAKANPDVMNQVTSNDVYKAQEDINNAYASGDPNAQMYASTLNNFFNTPNIKYAEPAIERLGLTDYYPDMGSHIRVGGYSGKIIGSNDIYTAQGGVLPMGMYDARKRALENAAKERAKNKEKLMDFLDIKAAYPYKQQFNDASMELMNRYGEAVNWDFNKLHPTNSKKGMEFYKEAQKLRALGNTTLELEQSFNKLYEAEKNEKEYVSPAQRQIADQFFRGNYDMSSLMKDPKKTQQFYSLANKAKAFDNAHFYVKDSASKLAEKLDENPIQIEGNLKDPKAAEELNQLLHKSSGMSYDQYLSGLVKYVKDERVDNLVEGLMSQHRFDFGMNEENTRNELKKMVLSYLPKQVQVKNDMQANKNFEMWKAKQDWAREDKAKETLYNTISNNMSSTDTLNNIGVLARLGKVNDIHAGIEKLTGGKRTRNGLMQYELPISAKDAASQIRQASEVFQPHQYASLANYIVKNKEKLGLDDAAISEIMKNPQAYLQGTSVKTTPIKEVVEYGYDDDNGKWHTVSEAQLKSNPNLTKIIKPLSRTTNKVVVTVDRDFGNYKKPVEVELPTAEYLTTLDNYAGIAEKDAQYSNLQQPFRYASDQGLMTDVKQQFAKPETQTGTLNAPQ